MAVATAIGLASCESPTRPDPTWTLQIDPGEIGFTALGQSAALTAVALEDGRRRGSATPVWSSDDPTVASVDSSGMVTAVGTGVTTVRGAFRTATASVMVVVEQIPETITSTPDSASFSALGDTLRVAVTVLDASGAPVDDMLPSFSVMDSTVARVSEDGLVEAIGPGTTGLVVTADPAGLVVPVAVMQAVASVVLSTDSVDFDAVGDTVRITGQPLDAGGAPTPEAPVWSSSDTTVARVSTDGVVTSIGPGVAEVQASAGGVAAVATVTVRQVVASIMLGVDSVLLADPGDTIRIATSAFDRLGIVIVDAGLDWMSANPSVAGVGSEGLITAIGAGVTRVYAFGGTGRDSVDIRVLPELALEVVGSSTPTGVVDESVPVSVRVTDLAGTPVAGAAVAWSAADGAITSPPSVVSDSEGVASAIWRFGTTAGAQSATATISTRGAQLARAFSADVVAGPAEVAALTADSVLLSGVGEDARIAPTFLDAHGNAALPVPVTWSSSDAVVANVSTEGIVTALGEGTAWVRWSLGGSVDSVLVTHVLRGAITVTFDDGWVTTYTNALPVMDEFSLRGNVGVYTEVVGFPAFMDLAQLNDLHDRGWAMVSHTVSHDSLTTLSDADLDAQLRLSQQWLVDQGFERGSGVLIAPYHDFGARERTAASDYYQAARGVSSNAFSPDSLVHWRPEKPLELTGIDTGQLPFTTEAGRDQLRALLQRVVDEGRFLDVLFHEVPPEDVDAFRETIRVVDEFRDRVVPYHELFPLTVRVVY